MGWPIRIYGRMGASEYPFKLRSSDAFSLYDLSRSQEGEYGINTITREMAKI